MKNQVYIVEADFAKMGKGWNDIPEVNNLLERGYRIAAMTPYTIEESFRDEDGELRGRKKQILRIVFQPDAPSRDAVVWHDHGLLAPAALVFGLAGFWYAIASFLAGLGV